MDSKISTIPKQYEWQKVYAQYDYRYCDIKFYKILTIFHKVRPLRNPARSVYLGLIGIFSSKYQVRGLIFLPE